MTCESCPWFHHMSGACRVHSPTVFLARHPAGPSADNPLGVVPIAFWPPMGKNDWCGEHPRRKGGLFAVTDDASKAS